MVIAPLDANTMAKMANGLCDNLLASAVIVKIESAFVPTNLYKKHLTLVFVA